MPILVKHSANPGVTATAAYGAGQGKKRAQAQMRGAQYASQQSLQRSGQKAQAKAEELRRQQMVEDRNFRRGAQIDDRERRLKFDADKAKWNRENRLADMKTARQLDFNKTKYGEARAAEVAAAARKNELADAQWERENEMADRDEKIYEEKLGNLSPDARQKYNEKRAAFQEAIADGSLSPAQIEEARAQLDDDLRTLVMNDIPSLEEPSKYPAGQGIGEQWYDEQTGEYNTRDSKGDVKSRPNPSVLTVKDINDAIRNAPKKKGPDGEDIPLSNAEIGDLTAMIGWSRRRSAFMANPKNAGKEFSEPMPQSMATAPGTQTAGEQSEDGSMGKLRRLFGMDPERNAEKREQDASNVREFLGKYKTATEAQQALMAHGIKNGLKDEALNAYVAAGMEKISSAMEGVSAPLSSPQPVRQAAPIKMSAEAPSIYDQLDSVMGKPKAAREVIYKRYAKATGEDWEKIRDRYEGIAK